MRTRNRRAITIPALVAAVAGSLLTGCTRELGSPAGISGADSNEGGTIVACVGGLSGFEVPPGATERLPLQLPDGRAVCPRAINAGGDIVGYVDYSENQVAVVRRHGTWRELASPVPVGSPHPRYADATDIDDAGRVAGVAFIEGDGFKWAATWDADTGAVRLLTAGGRPVQAESAAINDTGTVLGYGQTGVTVWDDPDAGRPIEGATSMYHWGAINDAGTFVLGLDLLTPRFGRITLARRGTAAELAYTELDLRARGWAAFVAVDLDEAGRIVGNGRRVATDADTHALRIEVGGTVTELAPAAASSRALSITGGDRVVGVENREDGTSLLVEWS